MLWLLFTIVYVQTGFQLGKKAEKVWKKGDSGSLESFLLFPVSHARGKVGGDMPFMNGINDANVLFRTLVTLGWPVMVAWNLLLVGGLLGPDKIIRRLTGGKSSRYEELAARLLKEEKKADRVIRRLEAPKKPRKPRASKQPKALPAVADAPPPRFAEPPPMDAFAPAVEHHQADPVQPPVQVRVTVDVTASGPATEETDRSDAEPLTADAQRVNTLGDKVVH